MTKQRVLRLPAVADGMAHVSAGYASMYPASDAKKKIESIFDQSLAVLQTGHRPEITPAADSAKVLRKSSAERKTLHLRSYSNSLPIYIDNVSLQRRALVDAAKALATLWKVPESRKPRLQNRGLQFSRETS